MQANSYILTGIPRSGSTLFLNLLSHNEDVICLDEPIWLKDLRQDNQIVEKIPQDLEKKITNIRQNILTKTPIGLVHQLGTDNIPTNHFNRLPNGEILKTKTTKEIIVNPNLACAPIIIKSNIFFTSILESIINSDNFKVIVTIRDPVATIKSWRSLKFSLSQGRSLIAEKYSSEVKEFSTNKDLLIRQVLLLDWMFKVYFENKSNITTFKYEEFIENPESLKSIIPHWKGEIKRDLKSRNKNSAYDHSEDKAIFQAIKENCKYVEHYYPYIFE